MESGWVTYNLDPILDIEKWVSENASTGQGVHIGTDSLQSGRYTQFLTVVIIRHHNYKGGRVAYQREVVPKISSLRERLMREAWRSVELGMKIAPLIPGELSIHLDANANKIHKSSKYVDELVGLVVGQGFKAIIKPDAWAASTCADHLVKHKGKLPPGFSGRIAV